MRTIKTEKGRVWAECPKKVWREGKWESCRVWTPIDNIPLHQGREEHR